LIIIRNGTSAWIDAGRYRAPGSPARQQHPPTTAPGIEPKPPDGGGNPLIATSPIFDERKMTGAIQDAGDRADRPRR